MQELTRICAGRDDADIHVLTERSELRLIHAIGAQTDTSLFGEAGGRRCDLRFVGWLGRLKPTVEPAIKPSINPGQDRLGREGRKAK